MKYFVECCGCDYRNGKTKGVLIHMHSINFYNFEERKDYKQGIEGSGENCPE